MVAPSTPVMTTKSLAERLRETIERASFRVAGEESQNIGAVRVTVSTGVACFGPEAHDACALIRRADEALYEAEGPGRSRVTVSGAADAAV